MKEKKIDYSQTIKGYNTVHPTWEDVYETLIKLMDKGEEAVIATACKALGKEITIDGVLTIEEVRVILSLPPVDFLAELKKASPKVLPISKPVKLIKIIDKEKRVKVKPLKIRDSEMQKK